MAKKLWFSVTAKDCEWSVFRGPGKGGQKRNKTSNAVRCVHPPSGAVGKASDQREQSENRKLAFERMAATDEFQSWMKLKIEAGQGNVSVQESDGQGGWSYPKNLSLEDV